jgi:hypothetical protein
LAEKTASLRRHHGGVAEKTASLMDGLQKKPHHPEEVMDRLQKKCIIPCQRISLRFRIVQRKGEPPIA